MQGQVTCVAFLIDRIIAGDYTEVNLSLHRAV